VSRVRIPSVNTRNPCELLPLSLCNVELFGFPKSGVTLTSYGQLFWDVPRRPANWITRREATQSYALRFANDHATYSGRCYLHEGRNTGQFDVKRSITNTLNGLREVSVGLNRKRTSTTMQVCAAKRRFGQ